jgi:transposase-like protein
MSEELTPEEVAILIRARQLLKKKGLSPDVDVSQICKTAGVSRKTGYQWAQKHGSESNRERQKDLKQKLARLQADHDQLKKDYEWISYENRGRKLAWEIHHVDELLALKKNTSTSQTDKKR